MTPYQRAFVIAEWRGLPEYPPKPDRTTCAADVIGGVMKSLGLGARLKQEQVLEAWHELVGDFIASNATPARLANGTLYVRVLQSTMHYELDRVWKQKILAKFKERFGARTVRDIRFQVG
jgi:predicted nucleic acid-binding Zn ribbon protein